MTRGRRKDTTIPPSRALTIQRAYRDRKAKYIADLEDRCRKAEEENERLRKELVLLRSGSAVASINSEMARVCSDLMQNLERTQKVLGSFQQRALGARPVPDDPARVGPSSAELDIAAILTHTLRRDPSAAESQQAGLGNTRGSTGSPLDSVADDNDRSECCGGFLDCSGLVE
ncbi:hypothetical protein BC827DRAFT_631502 [Russula dissimulans]|nr:hypothetical protein BC827DRAFT_631502 [Russula dissimulans]